MFCKPMYAIDLKKLAFLFFLFFAADSLVILFIDNHLIPCPIALDRPNFLCII